MNFEEAIERPSADEIDAMLAAGSLERLGMGSRRACDGVRARDEIGARGQAREGVLRESASKPSP